MRGIAAGRMCVLCLAALAFLAACSTPQHAPPKAFPTSGAQVAASVVLSQNGPALPDAKMSFTAVDGGETRISLDSIANRPITARLICAGPARLRVPGETGPGAYLHPGTALPVSVPAAAQSQRPVLVLPAATSRCTLSWGQGHTVTLQRDGAPVRVPADIGRCPSPALSVDDALARAFFAERAMDMSCAGPTGPVTYLPGEVDALRWRLEQLTGSAIPASAVAAADANMGLDFSNAPYFDTIDISYLFIRADFTGWVTARALAFHAARGTKIRVLSSGAITSELDRAPFRSLAAQYPNVSLQYFRFPAPGPGSALVSFQRSNHVKIFLARSPEPGRSFAVVGGRNLADGYFLPGAPDQPELPFLHSYGEESKEFALIRFHVNFDDYEIALSDPARVDDIAQAFERFYTRDDRTQTMRPAPGGAGPAVAASVGQARHFLSLPWADGGALEQLFVDLFDAAHDEIFVVSPFNYPTPAIEAALLRAAARGVDVRFVTRRGTEEPPAIFTKALNARFDDQTRGAIRFRLYEIDRTYLHAKIVVVDRRFGMVSSANLNRRSFYHDSENGVMFLDRAVAARLGEGAEALWSLSDPEDDKNPYAPVLKMFETLPWLEQFF